VTAASFDPAPASRCRTLGLCLVAMAAVATLSVTGLLSGAQTAQASTSSTPAFTVSLTQSRNVTNDQSLTLTVQRTTAGTTDGLNIAEVETLWCPPGIALPSETTTFGSRFGGLPNRTGNIPVGCADKALTTTTTETTQPTEGPHIYSPLPDVAKDYPTVVGRVVAEAGTTSTSTLTCGPAHPCALAVDITATVTNPPAGQSYYDNHWTDFYEVIPVTYAPAGITASCSGFASDKVRAVGPDRLGQANVDWDRGACASGSVGGGKAPVSDSSLQEGTAVLATFASGEADLAYSAVGYGATGFTPPVDRPYVAVPIAVNAVVVASGGGYYTRSVAGTLTRVPYGPIKLTLDQAAGLFGNGAMWTSTFAPAARALNPEFTNGVVGQSQPNAPVSTPNDHEPLQSACYESGTATRPSVDADVTATTLFASTFFNAQAGTEWNGHQTLGVIDSFAQLTAVRQLIDPFNGETALIKNETPRHCTGPIWALTDAASAASIWGGLTDAALQTPDSVGKPTSDQQYVGPTAAAMDAAVSEMIPQPDGTLLPNPDPTRTLSGVEPYPLTYVEYALAPAQPLLNTDCSPRTGSEQLLVQWLDYLTSSAGQAELPAGMASLTPALQAQAQAAIAKVGKSAVTGACATSATAGSPAATSSTGNPATTSSAGTSSTTPASAATSGTTSRSPSSGGSDTGSANYAATPARSPAGGSNGQGQQGPAGGTKDMPGRERSRTSTVGLAGFTAHSGGRWALPALGLLLLFVVLPGLALLISQRPPAESITRVAHSIGIGRQKKDDGASSPPGGNGEPT